MSFIVINKKSEEAIRRALLQLKNNVPIVLYKEIERILLNSIAHKRLSIYDINNVFSLLNSSNVLKNEKNCEEHLSKRNLQKNKKSETKINHLILFYMNIFL